VDAEEDDAGAERRQHEHEIADMVQAPATVETMWSKRSKYVSMPVAEPTEVGTTTTFAPDESAMGWPRRIVVRLDEHQLGARVLRLLGDLERVRGRRRDAGFGSTKPTTFMPVRGAE
jgi:hypothetical protein